VVLSAAAGCGEYDRNNPSIITRQTNSEICLQQGIRPLLNLIIH
jgi:hypothetical protein